MEVTDALPHCHSIRTTERSDRTAHDYRRFRCLECGRGFNERTGSVLNRLQLPSDVVFLIVLWRLRLKLSLRDLAEILLLRGLVFSHEAARDWETKLAPEPVELPAFFSDRTPGIYAGYRGVTGTVNRQGQSAIEPLFGGMLAMPDCTSAAGMRQAPEMRKDEDHFQAAPPFAA
ncbi:hypothetical protein ABNQ38_03970 [Azospirillum sp. A29]|uniref:hypothetical protein n=1 Tax=Azospirillum sp. A29 TaxID=3160606 RepID=UPI00367075D5